MIVEESEAGLSISTACQKFQQKLMHPYSWGTLIFNDIHIRVYKNSNVNDLITIYNLKHGLRKLIL